MSNTCIYVLLGTAAYYTLFGIGGVVAWRYVRKMKEKKQSSEVKD
jgi:hypothetical protein